MDNIRSVHEEEEKEEKAENASGKSKVHSILQNINISAKDDVSKENEDLRLLPTRSEMISTNGIPEKKSNDDVNDCQEDSLVVVDEVDEVEDTRCGIGQFKPDWLQTLASVKVYVFIYGMIGMAQFGLESYSVGTISTMEKRFKISSRTSGIISSGWDVGGLSFSLLLAYLGSRGHKTRWVAMGTILVGLSCFIRLIPHFLYGPGTDALELTEEYGASLENTTSGSVVQSCGVQSTNQEDCTEGDTALIAASIAFMSHILFGVGTSMYWTLGVPYLDDNARKNKTPVLLAVCQCLRLIGPTVGFLFASYALTIYIDPDVHPTITVDDPRWMGAWWLGWAPFGIINIILGISLLMFPKLLPRAAQRAAENLKKIPLKQAQKPTFKDFWVTMRRLFKNKVLMFNSFSSLCFIFGMIGYWTFMPKYMETQFRQSAASASLITGSVGLVFSALGLMTSGAVISWFKPRARLIAGWNVFVEFLDVLARIGYAFIGCPAADLHGTMGPNGNWDLLAECNSACGCGPTTKYSPVCSSDQLTTFYSSCHAGCSSQAMVNGTKVFDMCACVGGNATMTSATDGACPVDCGTNFIVFLVLECVVRFLSSTGRAGNTLVQIRCVDPDDKGISIGFTEALICALAFIPGSIIYGMILDSSCLVWGETCGQTGNCWLYDGQSLRYLLNFTAAGFLFAGTILDIGVWYNVKNLQIYDEEDADKEGDEEEVADKYTDNPFMLQELKPNK